MAKSDAHDELDKPAAQLEALALHTSDAQAARNATGTDIAQVEAVRTNASDGSLRDRARLLAEQEESIEIVGFSGFTSRNNKLSEKDLLKSESSSGSRINTSELVTKADPPTNGIVAEFEQGVPRALGLEKDIVSNQVQNLADIAPGRGTYTGLEPFNEGAHIVQQTSEKLLQVDAMIRLVATDLSLPEDKRALAQNIQEMRRQSNALGVPTEALDEFAKQALAPELASINSTNNAAQIQIDGSLNSSNQIVASNYMQQEVVIVTDTKVADQTERHMEYGYVSNTASGAEAWRKVAQLPEKTQAEIIATALKSNAECWLQEQSERAIGGLIGTVEGIGSILEDVAKVTDFAAACAKGDKETASRMGAEFGDSIGRMVVGGVDVLKISDQYLQDLGASGDWTKPAHDLAKLGSILDQNWSELPPKEQERLKYRFVTEFAGDILVPAAGVKILKAAKFTEVLPNMAKIAVKTGEELGQLPGDTQKTINAIRSFCKDATAAEALTPEGLRLKAPLEAARPGQDNLLMMVGKRPDFVKNLDKLEDVWRIREKLGVANERNIAIAEVSIVGKEGKLVGISGLKSPEGTCPLPKKPVLDYKPKGFEVRNDHSEFKILDQIAQGLDRSAAGTVKLFTERYPCDSCEPALDQFRSLFPNIKLEIEYGLGKR